MYRNDEITLDADRRAEPGHIVISPGPCTPNEAGVSVPLIQRFAGRIPILGVCLGHQSIGQAFGGRIVHAARLMHGKTSLIHHQAAGVFQGLQGTAQGDPLPFAGDRAQQPARELEVTAWTEDGEIMGVRHSSLPVEGVQFHPESILTEQGHELLRNFLALTR